MINIELSREDIELLVESLNSLKKSGGIMSTITEAQSLALEQRIDQVKNRLTVPDEK